MLNFLFGVLCAGGAVFGALLTYTGVINHSYEGVIAGGLFMFGSLLTFGIGQITRAMGARRTQAAPAREARGGAAAQRVHAVQRIAPGERPEPTAFAEGPQAEPIIPQPVLENVASRFARPR